MVFGLWWLAILWARSILFDWPWTSTAHKFHGAAGAIISVSHSFSSLAIPANNSIAACKSSAISCATTSGSSRLSASSRLVSLSQKMSIGLQGSIASPTDCSRKDS